MNGAELLVPDGVVTVTVVGPMERLHPIVNTAVICVVLTTFTLLTTTLAFATVIVAGDVKFVPVSVTGSPVAGICVPTGGFTDVNVGGVPA